MPKKNVIAAVIERNGLFLVCQRPAHKRHGMLWEFPGGKVEDGETLLQAAHRELMEELALKVSSIGELWLAIHDQGSEFVINFLAVEVEGEPQTLEHNALGWMSSGQLLELPLAPADRKFAEHLNLDRNA